MTDPTIKGQVTFDTSSAEKAFDKVERAAEDMAAKVKTSGEKAKPFEGIGKSSDEAAQKVDRNSKSLIASIQRQTAALEAGTKSGRQYYEVIAQQRGVSADVLKPYLDQLDAAKQKADAAARAAAGLSTSASAASTKAAGSFSALTTAASGAIRALAVFGAPATVGGLVMMANQIAASIDALNDLRDATGASIENISALESVAKNTGADFEVVSTSLIKFNQALGTTVKPGSDAERVLKAIGLSAKELRALDPAEALQRTAVALSRFADDGEKARAVQELFGKSLKEVAPFLKDLAEQGALVAKVTTKQAEEAEKFRKEVFKLQAALGDAGRAIAGPLFEALNESGERFRKAREEGNLFREMLIRLGNGPFGVGFNPVKSLFDFADPKKSAEDLQRELARINKSLEAGNLLESQRLALIRQQTEARRQLNALYGNISPEDANDALSRRLARPPSLDLPPPGSAAGRAGSRPDRPIDQAAVEMARQYADALRDLVRQTADLEAKNLGLGRAQTRLRQEMESPAWENYSRQQREQIILAAANLQAAEDEADARKKQAEYVKEARQSYEQWIEALKRGAEAAEDEVQRLKDEEKAAAIAAASNISLARAVHEVAIARLEEKRAQADGNDDALEKINREIAARREAINLLGSKEAREANKKSAEDAAKEWERTNERIADSFVDNLMRGGKSVAQYLKDLFRTLVLRPILQPVGNAFAGMIGSLPGGSGGVSGSGILGSIGNSAIGSAISGGFGALTAGYQGATLAAGLAGPTTAGASGLMGVGASLGAIPGLGWIVAGIAAIAALASSFKGETRVGGQYSNTEFIGGPSGGQIPGAQDLLGGTITSINATLAALGATDRLAKLVSGLEQSERGRGFAYAGGALTDGTVFGQGIDGMGYMNRRGSMTSDQALIAFGDEIKQATLQALKAADVPTVIADYLSSLGDIDSLNTAQLDAALAAINSQITAVQSLSQALEVLPFSELRDLSFDAAAGLIETAGGLEKLTGSLASYYENFFTEEEKRENVARNIANTLQAAGLNISEAQVLAAANSENAKQQFRDLADELGEGSPLWVALIGLSGAFASIVKEAGEAATALQQVQLGDVIEQFLAPEEVRQFRAGQIVDRFNAETGAGVTIEQVLGIDRDDFRQLFLDFAAEGNTAMTNALLNVAPLFASITPALEDFEEEVQQISEVLRGLQLEGQRLDVQILDALGMREEARAMLRSIETAGMTQEEIAQYDANQQKRDLLDQILSDIEAQQEAERGLGEIRRREAEAARQLREEWMRLGETMMDEVRRLRGEINSGNPAQSLAFQQAQFSIAAAAARAGDVNAAGRLVDLSQSVEEAALRSVGSLAELNTIRSQLSTTLEDIAITRGGQRPDTDMVGELRQTRDVFRDELRELRAQLAATNKRLEQYQRTATNIFEDWDANGLPAERDA